MQAAHGQRRADRIDHTLGNRHGIIPVIDIRKDHSEFITRQARGNCLRRKRVQHPVGHRLEQFIADGMTMHIIDFLEPVQVKADQGDHRV